MYRRVVATRGIALMITILLTGTVAAQDCVEYETYLHWAGGIDLQVNHVHNLAILDDYAFVTGSELFVIDIAGSSNPEVVGGLDIECSDVVISGHFAYVTAWDELLIIDISSPMNPQIVGRADVPGSDLTVAAGIAYVVGGGNPVTVLSLIDVSDQAEPQVIGSVEVVDGWVEYADVEVSGDYAYVSCGDLVVVDVSNPQTPKIIADIDSPGAAHAVAIAGDCAYVAGTYGLQVIGIENPEDPQEIGSMDAPAGYRIAVTVDGNHAYVADGSGGVEVIDITSPDSPWLAVDVPTLGFCRGVVLSGGRAYLPTAPNHMMPAFTGIQIIAFAGLEHSPVLGAIGTPGVAADVVVSGSYSYVADGIDGLQVIDVGFPEEPQITGAANTPGDAAGVAISGHWVYVADSGSGLQVVDVADPADPQIVGHVDTPGWARHVAIQGAYAYVADDSTGLQIIDITDPEAPQIVASIPTPGAARDVAVSGDHALVADGSLQVIDIADPLNPWIAATLVPPEPELDWYLAVAVRGNRAYVVNVRPFAMGSLLVVDIADPLTPRIIGSQAGLVFGSLWPGGCVQVSGEYAYVSDAFSGLQVVDVSDSEQPRLIGGHVTHDWLGASGLSVSDDFVYLVDASYGLGILPMQCASSVSTEDAPEDPNPELPSGGLNFVVYPNPFNPQTIVSFSLAHSGWTNVCVYDLTGRQVTNLATGSVAAGQHSITWTGRDADGRVVPSGAYIVRLETEERVESRKVMLIN